MFEKLISMFQSKTPPALIEVLERFGGGVHKRIDENRELLELLQQKTPQLLAECPWIEGWLRSNDQFFRALEVAMPIGAINPHFAKRPGFPRDWPEPKAIPRHADSEKFAAERNGIQGLNLVTRTQVEDFLDACGLVPETANWEGALIGIPIEVDGGSVRFIRQP